MTKKSLALDSNSFPIQTLELGETTTKLTVGVATSSVALPTGCIAGDIVRLASNTDCYFAFGTSGVTATTQDALFTQGVEIMQVPRGTTHVAAIRVSASGILTITEVY